MKSVESIPGVYSYDAERSIVNGSPEPFVDLASLDEEGILRYELSPEEIRHYRLYGGSHGLVGPRYWPIALVRGCPYACTYCAAYQMSGKRLRFRSVNSVVDDIEFYLKQYRQRFFSFVDDAFTEDYEFVVEFCREILRRKLHVFWTTDNGIRYESLGAGKRLTQFLNTNEVANRDDLFRLMMQAGWRGTSIGLESGSGRVRDELVRKGGARISNASILENLMHLRQAAQKEHVYFYINAYVMIGFPELVLRNGNIIAAETDEEREETYSFIMKLRSAGAIDFVHPSVVIPLPATEMWDHLSIAEKVSILTSRIPEQHPARDRVRQIVDAVSAPGNRYSESAEARFWIEVYKLPDDVQLLIHGSYDMFNADASYKIILKRQQGDVLWKLRQQIMEDFYGGVHMEYRLMKHVFAMCSNAWEVIGYLTCLGRIYMPETKERHMTGHAAL
jgi:Radical SAM superfamily